MATARLAHLTSVRRLPGYLRALTHFQKAGRQTISTTSLAAHLGMDAITVRKDLAITGVVGRPGLGYQISELLEALQTFLGWHNETDAFVVGMGNLGMALAGYEGFRRHGLNIVAGFDIDPARCDPEGRPVPVFPPERLKDLARRMGVRIGVLTVPAEAAQEAADALVQAGILALWNFTPTEIKVPDGVIVQREDLTAGFAVLSRKLHHALRAELEEKRP